MHIFIDQMLLGAFQKHINVDVDAYLIPFLSKTILQYTETEKKAPNEEFWPAFCLKEGLIDPSLCNSRSTTLSSAH